MTKNQILNIVKIYIKNLKKANIPIKESYIFGSYAKGKLNKNSDIDVAIVSPIFGKDRQKERVLLMNLRDEQTLLIEPHPISPSELRLKLNPIITEISKTAIKIS